MANIGTNTHCPPGVCLLADHLDTALAVGEDLLALSLPPRADLDEADPEGAPEAVERFVLRLRALEEALLARVLQARRRMGEVAFPDAAMRSAAALFNAQTDTLLDLIESTEADTRTRFDGGGDSFAYLRARGLIAPEAAAPSPYESVDVTEAFRVAGVTELGALMDLVSAVLDLLDARYGLYPPGIDDEVAAEVTAKAGTDVASDVAPAAAAGPQPPTLPSPAAPLAPPAPGADFASQVREALAAARAPTPGTEGEHRVIAAEAKSATSAAAAATETAPVVASEMSRLATAREQLAALGIKPPVPAPIRQRSRPHTAAGADAGGDSAKFVEEKPLPGHRSLLSAIAEVSPAS